jgi:hypothetical protein
MAKLFQEKIKYYYYTYLFLYIFHGAMGCGQKSYKGSVVMPPAPLPVPSQRPLAPSVTSVANDKGDNEMIPGAVHRSPKVCLTVEGNPGKP